MHIPLADLPCFLFLFFFLPFFSLAEPTKSSKSLVSYNSMILWLYPSQIKKKIQSLNVIFYEWEVVNILCSAWNVVLWRGLTAHQHPKPTQPDLSPRTSNTAWTQFLWINFHHNIISYYLFTFLICKIVRLVGECSCHCRNLSCCVVGG